VRWFEDDRCFIVGGADLWLLCNGGLRSVDALYWRVLIRDVSQCGGVSIGGSIVVRGGGG